MYIKRLNVGGLMKTSEDLAVLTNVSKVYGENNSRVIALNNVSLRLKKGEFTAIVGASGSGKSTLLHCLVGLDSVSSGTVNVADQALNLMNDAQLTKFRLQRVGFVFQAFNLLPNLNVEENIMLPLLLAGKKQNWEKVRQVAATLGLQTRLRHLPAELSGGQQQRVAIARALIMQPALLVCDEPTGNLDSKSGQEVMTILRQAVDELQQTVVVVTHDRKVAATADRVIVISDGEIANDVYRPEMAFLQEVI